MPRKKKSSDIPATIIDRSCPPYLQPCVDYTLSGEVNFVVPPDYERRMAMYSIRATYASVNYSEMLCDFLARRNEIKLTTKAKSGKDRLTASDLLTSRTESTLREIAACFLAVPSNLLILYTMLSKPVRTLICNIFDRGAMPTEEAANLYGIKIMEKISCSWWATERISPRFCFFFDIVENCLVLRTDMRRVISTILSEQPFSPATPPAEATTWTNAGFIKEISELALANHSSPFSIGATGKYLKKDFENIGRIISNSQSDSSPLATPVQLHIIMAVQFRIHTPSADEFLNDTLTYCKKIPDALPLVCIESLTDLLTDFKGVTPSRLRNLNIGSLIGDLLKTIISEFKDSDYLDFHTLLTRASAPDTKKGPYDRLLLFGSEADYKKHLEKITISYSGQYLSPDLVKPLLSRQIVAWLAYVLAVCNLAEIHILPAKSDGIGDRVAGLSLTPLGRYVLLKGKAPEIKVDLNYDNDFELMPSATIILVKNQGSPLAPFIKEIGENIGKSLRYVVTPASFIANVDSNQVIADRVDRFRMFFESKITQVWMELLTSVQRNNSALKKNTDLDYKFVFVDIDPSNAELIDFLNNDFTLRQWIIRTESCFILVKKEKYQDFRAHLIKKGYYI